MMEIEERRMPWRGTRDRRLWNIWNAKRLESEYGDCPNCGKKDIEFKIWQLADGAVKKYAECPDCTTKRNGIRMQEETEEKQRELSIIRERWRKECGIPTRFTNSKFSEFDMNVDRTIKQVYSECVKYAEEFSSHTPQNSKSLLMYSCGVWGVGKTYLACAIANAVLDKWNGEIGYCPIYFISEPQLFLRVRSTYNRRNNDDDRFKETEEDIYKQLTKVPLLVLDDVGKEEVSDPRFVQRVLFAIIDGRYQSMLPIIITANLTPDELDSHLGGSRGNSASMDRLAEMTGNIFWELKGRSYRDATNRLPRKIRD